MSRMLLTCAGVAGAGAVAALARYGTSLLFTWGLGATFPWGTLVINVTGSFLLGWLNAALGGSDEMQMWRIILGIGFLGTFTTFSTMMFESHKMIDTAQYLKVAAYLAASLFLGLLAVRLGTMAAGK